MRDAAAIRHAAVAEGILCLTAMETAIAAAEALDPTSPALADVRPLHAWVPSPGIAPGWAPDLPTGRGPTALRGRTSVGVSEA